jgi:subtilisin-like proprotein convertase family protein
MRNPRTADPLSFFLVLCCVGEAGCSDDLGEAVDESSSTGDPTDASATMTMDPSTTDDVDSSSTEPGTDSDGESSSDDGDSSSESTGERPECDLDGDCDDAAPCTENQCVEGTCTFSPIDGISAPPSEQTAGDCQIVFCVAGEPSDQADDADLPDDGDDCTADLCMDGIVSHPPADLPMCVPEPVCDNGIDDDIDGLADCLDADCDGIAGCELGTESTCDDGFDNDVDAAVDCSDADCNGVAGCELGAEFTCTDAFDNDGDGSTDCSDGDCFLDAACLVEVCDNSVDDDLDGVIDCADPDCAADDSCIPEANCNDGIDNDGNGLVDGAEPVCSWVSGALPGCAAGHAFAFAATDLPQSIPAVGTSTRNSYIPVALASTVADVAVRIYITHTYDSDLDILLYSPSATSRELSTDNGGVGGSGDNFHNTIFTDAGPGVIGSAGFDNPPYTGTYRPEQAFGPTLDGQTTDGSWNLRVIDQFNLDGGSIDTFQLALCTQ